MLYLVEKGFRVIGVEFSPVAIEAFMTENNLKYSTKTHEGGSIQYIADVTNVAASSGGSLSIVEGDIFGDAVGSALQAIHASTPFGSIWDRASLIALNPEDREKYAALLLSFLPVGCNILQETVQYNQRQMFGPPWSVDAATTSALYSAACEVQTLEVVDVSDALKLAGGKWKHLTALHEITSLITRK